MRVQDVSIMIDLSQHRKVLELWPAHRLIPISATSHESRIDNHTLSLGLSLYTILRKAINA